MPGAPEFGAPTPILRSFDEAKAREFYIDFLGFDVEFEHRFEPDAPLYLGLIRGACRLHISEHFGDATPGSRLRLPVAGLIAYQEHLAAKTYRHARPGPPQDMPWGDLEMTISDPFGNKINFFEASRG